MDCSLPGSSAPGIFQARVLEWVSIAFSEKMYRKENLACEPRFLERLPGKLFWVRVWEQDRGEFPIWMGIFSVLKRTFPIPIPPSKPHEDNMVDAGHLLLPQVWDLRTCQAEGGYWASLQCNSGY